MSDHRSSEPDGGSAEQPATGDSARMGAVAGRTVQARDVQGGIHFYGQNPPTHSSPVPGQLPGDVHGFVNRIGELEVLSTHLSTEDLDGASEAPVHVITGTAGVGKTALALHWAHRVRDRFPDGQLYVDLRGYGAGRPIDPDQALERFVRAFGVPADAVPADLDDRSALYRSLLAERRVLVVLDNAATAAQVRPLLPGSSACVVLVTSRDRLSGLVARDGARRLTVRTLEPEEAVELLEHVTESHRPRDEPHEVAELARLCGELPLALRIAAERAAGRPHMPLAELIQDLRDESALWDALATDDEDEADAVRSVFAWSYRALPEETARLFRLLGLHPGHDFDAGSAAVLGDFPLRRARRVLDTLVGAHLVEQIGPDRYRFHDLLRSYALDQARREESPESRYQALERLLNRYLCTADSASRAVDSPLRRLESVSASNEDAAGDIREFADNADAVRWFEAENRNLVALTEAASEAGMDSIAWRLPIVLRHVYVYRTPMNAWISTTLLGLGAARREQEHAAEAELLESLGMAYVQSHRTQEGIERHRHALRLRRELGDELGEAMSLNALGLAHLREHRVDRAREVFERSLATARRLGERTWEGIVLGNLADALLDSGDLHGSVALAEKARAILRETGNRMSEFACLVCLGTAWRHLGSLDRALSYVLSALDVARELDNAVREGFALLELGRIHELLDRPEEALANFHEAALLHRSIGDHVREARSFEGAGQVHRSTGRLKESARFFRQAAIGYRRNKAYHDLAECLDRLATVLSDIGEPEAAREHRREALKTIADLSDPRAERLRETVTARLTDPSPS